MNFQFSDEAEALRESARKFLGERADKPKARAVMESGASHDAALWAEIVALGWPALRIPEAHGGLGLSILDLCVLAEEVGRALAPVPFTSSVLLATEALLIAGTPEQQAHWLPKLAEGSAIGTVALTAKPVATGILAPVHDAAASDFIIYTAPDGLHLVETSACTVEPVETIDLVRRSSRVTLPGAGAQPMAGGPTAAEAFQHSAAILLAFEGLGGADAAMEMALAYTQQRVAFGRKIAGYQAVKHRLADMYIKNQLARSHAYYGAWDYGDTLLNPQTPVTEPTGYGDTLLNSQNPLTAPSDGDTLCRVPGGYGGGYGDTLLNPQTCRTGITVTRASIPKLP